MTDLYITVRQTGKISPIITRSFTKQTRVSYCIGYGCVTDMSVGIRSLRAVVHLYPR